MVTVMAEDSFGESASIAVTIMVTDVDEAPEIRKVTTVGNVAPEFPSATATRMVAENTAAGENIGTPVRATDANGDSLTYRLSGTDAASFDIDAATGQLMTLAALDYAAVRARYTVRFVRADDFFKAMAQARVDNSVDRTFRSFLSPDLLILDDLGLHRLTAQQSADLYELILIRHRASSFVITSNRSVDEWLSLFDDPILGNSALDRLANASYQIVIEGSSYRERQSPHRKLLGLREVIDSTTAT